jgi:general secretion pathway protein E
MNAPHTNIPAVANISAIHITQANHLAKTEKRRVLETLESLADWSQESFVCALADAMQYVPISMKEMHTFSPAFDVIPFSLAQKKRVFSFY